MVVRVRVKQIPEGSGGVSHANIWDKSNGGKEESTCIVPKMDTCIGYGKEAHVAGVQQGAEYQEMRMEKQAGAGHTGPYRPNVGLSPSVVRSQ